MKPGVESVTLAYAHRIGREWIKPGSLQVLVVGDREVVEPGLRELEIPLAMMDPSGERMG